MRLFLDANILFSAAASDGSIRQLVARLVDDGHELVADLYVWEEAHRNLAARHPGALDELARLASSVDVILTQAVSSRLADDLTIAEKDRPVLAAAIVAKTDGLLTGDRRHFGAVYGTTIRGVTIYSPSSLAEELFD